MLKMTSLMFLSVIYCPTMTFPLPAAEKWSNCCLGAVEVLGAADAPWVFWILRLSLHDLNSTQNAQIHCYRFHNERSVWVQLSEMGNKACFQQLFLEVCAGCLQAGLSGKVRV